MNAEDEQRICLAIAQQRNVIVISQQRDEPDPTQEQKMFVLLEKLRTKPGVFLQRFGTNLPDEMLQLFEPLRKTNYIIDFEIKTIQDERLNKTSIVRNRYVKYDQSPFCTTFLNG